MTPRTKRVIKDLQRHLPAFPDGPWEIKRTWAGHHQKSAGAFSFYFVWKGDPKHETGPLYSNAIGSRFSMRDLDAYKIGGVGMSGGDAHIYPREI